MDPIEIELLRGEVDALVADLDAERHRHVAGLEGEPELGAAFRRRSRAAHRDTVRELEAAGEVDLARRVAALRAERAQAEEEEAWRAAEPAARALGPDGPVPLDAAQLAVVRERDRARRLAFGRAAAEAADQPAREVAVETRARARAEVGLLPDWERVVAADALLSASDDGYRDVLSWLARREAGLSPGPGGDLERADLLFALALHGWDGLFPRGMLALVLERTAGDLGLDLGQVRVDEAARAGQWPGAHAHGPRVSFRRQGGASDWLGLFDAIGRGLSAASAPASRRDPAAPAACGALLAGLLLDARYLASRLDVDRKHAPDLARALALRQLFRLRASAAALRVGTEVERGLSGGAWREAHREALTGAALAAWPPGLAARDGDAARHALALAGAARAEALRRRLIERFDEDWWRNPRTREALRAWLAGGSGWDGDEPPLALAAGALLVNMQ